MPCLQRGLKISIHRGFTDSLQHVFHKSRRRAGASTRRGSGFQCPSREESLQRRARVRSRTCAARADRRSATSRCVGKPLFWRLGNGPIREQRNAKQAAAGIQYGRLSIGGSRKGFLLPAKAGIAGDPRRALERHRHAQDSPSPTPSFVAQIRRSRSDRLLPVDSAETAARMRCGGRGRSGA